MRNNCHKRPHRPCFELPHQFQECKKASPTGSATQLTKDSIKIFFASYKLTIPIRKQLQFVLTICQKLNILDTKIRHNIFNSHLKSKI
jgi:hypothetical protein